MTHLLSAVSSHSGNGAHATPALGATLNDGAVEAMRPVATGGQAQSANFIFSDPLIVWSLERSNPDLRLEPGSPVLGPQFVAPPDDGLLRSVGGLVSWDM